eukprot:1748153-Lingulodinium_polyedra.AAC.1
MPLRSCDFWRLTNEAAARSMAGSQQGGIWACPVCVRRWTWGAGGARRVLAIRTQGRWRFAYIG